MGAEVRSGFGARGEAFGCGEGGITILVITKTEGGWVGGWVFDVCFSVGLDLPNTLSTTLFVFAPSLFRRFPSLRGVAAT